MNVDENLVNGRAHFGALSLLESLWTKSRKKIRGCSSPRPGNESWKKPLIELDEDYVGNYHIKKNMNLYTYSDDDLREDPWLPCCSGGFSDMNYEERKCNQVRQRRLRLHLFQCPRKGVITNKRMVLH